MFGGSEHSDQSWFTPMQQIGATDMNGTTWFDRTNYFETVPRGALETALVPRIRPDGPSARRGHPAEARYPARRRPEREAAGRQPALRPRRICRAGRAVPARPSLSSLDDRLDGRSRRRQPGDGEGLVPLALRAEQCGAGARRRHRPGRRAQRLVEKYFGDIPRGPADRSRPRRACRRCRRRSREELHDQVATTRLYREWVVPGPHRSTAMPRSSSPPSVLGGLSSSRLDNALVRGDKLAVSVTAGVEPFERVSMFEVTARRQARASIPAAVARPARPDHRRLRRGTARPPTSCSAPRPAWSRAGSAGSNRSAASAARRSRSPRARSMPAIPASTRSQLAARSPR